MLEAEIGVSSSSSSNYTNDDDDLSLQAKESEYHKLVNIAGREAIKDRLAQLRHGVESLLVRS